MRQVLLSFFAIVLALMLAPAGASANEPACKGHDLIARMQADQPGVFADVMAKAAQEPNGEAMFWRIDGASNGQPSWLLGTIHLSDDRVTTLSPAVRQAIKSAQAVALEVANIADKAEMTKQAMSDPSIILLPSGESLWDQMDSAAAGTVEKQLAAVGIAKEQAAPLQPWLLATMLSVSPCIAQRAAKGHPGVDQVVAEQAGEAGKKIVGLETVKEQLGAMSSMSMKAQTAFLVSSVKLYPQIDDYMETMVQAYLNRHITALLPFQAAHLKSATADQDAAAMNEFIDKLVVRRNHTMAERAKPHLEQGGIVIAVGALHLPGKEGLVALIRQQGFKVVPVE